MPNFIIILISFLIVLLLSNNFRDFFNTIDVLKTLDTINYSKTNENEQLIHNLNSILEKNVKHLNLFLFYNSEVYIIFYLLNIFVGDLCFLVCLIIG